MSGSALVGVVTPFYNTAPYLSECIESVLAQSYENFEYLLVDNCSDDGSSEIARAYAARDPRIRYVRNSTFVNQLQNYNGALRLVSPAVTYIKIVQADDRVFADCLSRLVGVAERHPRIGIVASFYLSGDRATGWGVPIDTECLPGREVARAHLLGSMGTSGNPTVVLYRAEAIADRKPCFREESLHADTELFYEILQTWDFGFVHQVLGYIRIDNESTRARSSTANWTKLDAYITLRRYGTWALGEREHNDRLSHVRRDLLIFLGESLLFAREPFVWDYYRRGLASIGERLPLAAAVGCVPRAVGKAMIRPSWAWRMWRASLLARSRDANLARPPHPGDRPSVSTVV